jgi:hypothetical protein
VPHPIALLCLEHSGYIEYTTPSSQHISGLVTVTHPCHPLFGQQVEIVRIRRGTDPDLVIRLPDGLHIAIAMSLTDYAGPGADPAPSPLHLLDFEGLCHIVQLIDRMRKEGHCPSA